MTRNEAPATTNYYALSRSAGEARKGTVVAAVKRLAPLMADEKRHVAVAVAAMLTSSVSGLLGPVIIAHTVDTYVGRGDFGGVLEWAAVLLTVYLVGLVSSYVQTQNTTWQGLALQGRKTFLKYRCLSCHSPESNRAPLLEELFERRTVRLQDGREVPVDEEYIRDSILAQFPGAWFEHAPLGYALYSMADWTSSDQSQSAPAGSVSSR